MGSSTLPLRGNDALEVPGPFTVVDGGNPHSTCPQPTVAPERGQ